MGVCDCCGHLTDRPEYHPGPYGTVVLCPLCAGLGAVAHLTVAAADEDVVAAASGAWVNAGLRVA